MKTIFSVNSGLSSSISNSKLRSYGLNYSIHSLYQDMNIVQQIFRSVTFAQILLPRNA